MRFWRLSRLFQVALRAAWKKEVSDEREMIIVHEAVGQLFENRMDPPAGGGCRHRDQFTLCVGIGRWRLGTQLRGDHALHLPRVGAAQLAAVSPSGPASRVALVREGRERWDDRLASMSDKGQSIGVVVELEGASAGVPAIPPGQE